MYKLKQIIKKLIPKFLLNFYHWSMAHLAKIRYGNPSKKLVVIGVTGTNGKSTVTEIIAKLLEGCGKKVGFTSTVKFKVGKKEWLNKTKMTMTGRFYLQKILKDMVKAGCEYAVIETSSQGLEQYRHVGINYDMAVFTNLTPEHIEAHGGFENYKKAKGKLFKHLMNRSRKELFGQVWEKTSIVNLADEHANYFADFPAEEKWGFFKKKAFKKDWENLVENLVFTEDYNIDLKGSEFTVSEQKFKLNFLGEFNIDNALAALTVGRRIGLTWEEMADSLAKIEGVPGRMEVIDEGQSFGVLVDYAPEPASFGKLYETVKILAKQKIIHVFGSCGGGRDVARRPILGKMAGEMADYCIITNEDPYDDDPMEIINDVAAGCLKTGKVEGKNLLKILDRKEAIAKAFSLAEPGDLVLLTGKGAEQAIMIAGGKKQDWDEREVARELLKNKK